MEFLFCLDFEEFEGVEILKSKSLLNDLLQIRFREGNGTPLQYSCLENPMDRGAW